MLNIQDDLLLTCTRCANHFTFSVRDQAYFRKMNFDTPKRCSKCKELEKSGNPSKFKPRADSNIVQSKFDEVSQLKIENERLRKEIIHLNRLLSDNQL